MTKWLMAGPKGKQGILHRALRKNAGCLMTVDGSGDEKIQD